MSSSRGCREEHGRHPASAWPSAADGPVRPRAAESPTSKVLLRVVLNVPERRSRYRRLRASLLNPSPPVGVPISVTDSTYMFQGFGTRKLRDTPSSVRLSSPKKFVRALGRSTVKNA